MLSLEDSRHCAAEFCDIIDPVQVRSVLWSQRVYEVAQRLGAPFFAPFTTHPLRNCFLLNFRCRDLVVHNGFLESDFLETREIRVSEQGSQALVGFCRVLCTPEP